MSKLKGQALIVEITKSYLKEVPESKLVITKSILSKLKKAQTVFNYSKV